MKKLIHYIVGGLTTVVLMGGIFGITPQETYACSSTDQDSCVAYCANKDNSTKTECQEYFTKKNFSETWQLANTLDNLLSVIYLFAWPMMYVAGLAMDNTLVSGEVFGISGLLYQFWTIMRTVANVLIVMILVWTIGEQMFKGSKGAKELGKYFLAILIGGIMINASWFLIHALVDLSTVATYGVGMLPVTVSSNQDEYCDKNSSPKDNKKIGTIEDIAKLGNCRPILSTNTTLNISEALGDKSARKAYYTYQPTIETTEKQYFLSCPFKNDRLTKDEWEQTIKNFKTSTGGNTETADFKSAKEKINQDYCVVGNQLLNIKTPAIVGSGIIIGTGDRNERMIGGMGKLHARGGERVRTLVDANRGTIGLSYNLYGNLLGFANIKNTPSQATAEGQIIQFMIKLFFGFAMIFPLIALCIVLVMRVAVLWMVIGFAPILMLWRVFNLMGIKNDKLNGIAEGIGKKLTLTNVVNLLFQPVLIVFVLSIGMMFLEALSSMIVVDGSLGEVLKCDLATKCCNIEETNSQICMESGGSSSSGVSSFFNLFGYSIINIIGVLLLYFMTFAVMKSSEITAAATEKIKGLGSNLMGALPVIPWFDGSFVGATGAKAGLTTARDKVTEKYEDTSGGTVTQPWVEQMSDRLTGKVSTAQSEVRKASNGFTADDVGDKGTIAKVKDFGNKITEALGKQSGSVQQATADELTDKSDPATASLLKRYGAGNMRELLSNPRFMAEIGKGSDKLVDIYAPNNKKRTGTARARKEYFDTLAKQAKEIGSDFTSPTLDLKKKDGGVYFIKKGLGPNKDELEVNFKELADKPTMEATKSFADANNLTIDQLEKLKLHTGSQEIEETTKDANNQDIKTKKTKNWKAELDKDGKIEFK